VRLTSNGTRQGNARRCWKGPVDFDQASSNPSGEVRTSNFASITVDGGDYIVIY
jgi:hypothetical protein